MEFVAFVIALALLEFAVFGMLVGWARGKYKVAAPAIGGHPVFERYFRAHQNTWSSSWRSCPRCGCSALT